MSDNLADSAARLERLVARIMKETDPVKYDELGAEIWRALSERERLLKQSSPRVKAGWAKPPRSRWPRRLSDATELRGTDTEPRTRGGANAILCITP